MKKRFLVGLLTGVMMISMLACGKETEPEAITEEKEESETQAEEVLASNEYSCDYFTMELPEQLKEIAEVETTQDSITVYYKKGKEDGFGGLAYSISARKLPSEYAGGPYSKVGEIEGDDGTTYDVVLGVATEVQWDYNLPDMPEDFAKIYDSADSVVKNLIARDGYTYNCGAGINGEDLYGEVIDKYITAVNEKWDAAKLEAEGMSPEYAFIIANEDKPLEKIGVSYADVNADGIDELFVGVILDEDRDLAAYDVYTMVDRKPEHVISGSEAVRFYNYESFFIAKEWNGVDSSGIYIYGLEANSTEMTYQFGYKYDPYDSEAGPWFRSYDGEEYEPISEEDYSEATKISEAYEELNYLPLSQF
jgi:hypothetical protein